MNWIRIFRNIFSNWTSYAVTAVVGFLLTPIVVRSLGDTGYGLWTLVLSITGYFGLLDLGIRSSVSRFLARHLALDDDQGVNRTASTAFVLLGLGGLVALLATVVIATIFLSSFQIEPAYASQARTALLLAGLNVSFILPLGIFSAVLYASERFDVVSAVSIVAEVTRAALVWWLLSHGYGLVALSVLALAITLVQYAAYLVAAKALHPRLGIAFRYVDRTIGSELLGFSLYRFVWIIANQLVFYSDALVIGIFLGASAITPFAIAGTLINYGRQIVFLVIDPFYPPAARMDARSDIAGLQRLLILGTRIALLVALPLCLGFVFLGRQFITLWMKGDHVGSAAILTILTIPLAVSLPQYVSALVMAGMARHRTLAFVALGEGAANIVLSVILIQSMGLIGVAWGTVIPALITNTMVVPFYTLRVLNMSFRKYVTEAYVRPVLSVLPIVVMAYSFSRIATVTWLTFLAEVMSIAFVVGVMSYFLCLYSEQRSALAGRVAALFRRTPAAHEV
jgi:O-antigen/teichoic acid export membrane protein